MYELKFEAIKIMQTLKNNNYDAYFVNNYPFVKCNNSFNSNYKLNLKNIEIVTDAKLDFIQNNFDVVKVVNDFNKYAVLKIIIKDKTYYFKLYYLDNYYNKINNNIIKINSINDIINNFTFSFETLLMDENLKITNYVSKKTNAFLDIKNKIINPIGKFREKILENPIRILQLLYYASNINYTINNSNIKIIANNFKYLKYENKQNIISYFYKILLSKKPSIGLKLIKNNIIDFEYNEIKLFEFLKNIDDNYLDKMDNFKGGIDLISRLAYLLNTFNDINLCKSILNNFDFNNSDKVIWMIENFDIIKSNNIKLKIYESRDSLSIIDNSYDIFLLFEMYNRLTKLYTCLDKNLENKCQLIIDSICSRPYFKNQIKYNDEDLLKIGSLNKENINNKTLDIAKEYLIKSIINCDKHPDDEEYINLIREALEYSMINSLF